MGEVDALCHVLRAFASDTHPDAPNPAREIADLEAEIVLADLDLMERRVQKLTKERGSPRELELLSRLRDHLEQEKPLRTAKLSADDSKVISGYRFLSAKPLLCVANVDESAVAEPVPADIEEAAGSRGLTTVVLSGRIEMEIAQMADEEQPEFYESLGLKEPARDRFIRAAFALLDLISMLTAGPDECRAWPIRRGQRAPQAAGKIHSDIERGFIRAETITYDDFVACGGEQGAKDAGKMRAEGRDYPVKDGDVFHFRFNV